VKTGLPEQSCSTRPHSPPSPCAGKQRRQLRGSGLCAPPRHKPSCRRSRIGAAAGPGPVAGAITSSVMPRARVLQRRQAVRARYQGPLVPWQGAWLFSVMIPGTTDRCVQMGLSLWTRCPGLRKSHVIDEIRKYLCVRHQSCVDRRSVARSGVCAAHIACRPLRTATVRSGV
jgi:hypothetical protein